MLSYVNLQPKHGSRVANPLTSSEIPLVVFLDADSFDDGDEDVAFLLKQTGIEKLTIISTRREGSAYLEFVPREKRYDSMGLDLVRLDGSGVAYHAISPLSEYEKLVKIAERSSLASSEEANRAFMVAAASMSIKSHVFVTNDQFLLDHYRDFPIIKNSQPMTSTEALALIGLVLRRRNNLSVIADRQSGSTLSMSYDRSTFFDMAVRNLLPSAHTLLTNLPQSLNGVQELMETSYYRTTNALKCRDHIHEQILLEQTHSSTEDATFYFDYYLVCLVAAFDTLARAIDDIYGMSSPTRNISWRREDWRERLREKEERLAILMSPSGRGGDVLLLLSKLRNYIHAEALQGVMHRINGKPAPLLVRIPEAKVAEILDTIERMDGGSWRIKRLGADEVFLEIGEIIERVTPLACRVVDEIFSVINASHTIDGRPKAHGDMSEGELKDIQRLLGIQPRSLLQ